MRFKIKYGLLSFLLLLAVIHTAVGGTVVSPAAGKASLYEKTEQNINLPGPVNESDLKLTDCLSGLSLCNIQVQQTCSGLAFKRMQGDKDLLLLHASKLSDSVKATSGDHIKFADSLTHISLFLFPHHFFW